MSEDWLAKYEAKHSSPARREGEQKVLSTSYMSLDTALGIGGLPLGKVIDIAGGPGVGKSSLAMDIVVEAQDKNLAAVWIDLEHCFDESFAYSRKIKLEDLPIFHPKNIENIAPACVSLMKEGLADIIIFDSISAMNRGDKSVKDIINPLLKEIVEFNSSLIFLSQIRTDLVEGGTTTPSNNELDHICNVRMMLRKMESIKHQEVLIGKRVEVDIYKNELASPAKTFIELYI